MDLTNQVIVSINEPTSRIQDATARAAWRRSSFSKQDVSRGPGVSHGTRGITCSPSPVLMSCTLIGTYIHSHTECFVSMGPFFTGKSSVLAVRYCGMGAHVCICIICSVLPCLSSTSPGCPAPIDLRMISFCSSAASPLHLRRLSSAGLVAAHTVAANLNPTAYLHGHGPTASLLAQ